MLLSLLEGIKPITRSNFTIGKMSYDSFLIIVERAHFVEMVMDEDIISFIRVAVYVCVRATQSKGTAEHAAQQNQIYLSFYIIHTCCEVVKDR